jgi:hypothetical protein
VEIGVEIEVINEQQPHCGRKFLKAHVPSLGMNQVTLPEE